MISLRPLLISAAVFNLLVSALAPAANAETKPTTELPRIRSCAITPKENCIVSIKGLLPNGDEIQAKVTGRSQNGDWEWGKYSKVTGPVDEWEFPGVSFENGSGKFSLNTFYFPDGVEFCWESGQCSKHQEQLNFYANASDIDSFKQPFIATGKKAELACPGKQNDCVIGTSWSFNSDVKWTVTFSLKNDFVPTISTGRIKQLKVAYEKINSRNLVIEYAPLKLDHVPYDKPDLWIFEEAFFQNDSPALWVHGRKHDLVQSLGSCSEGGGLQVVSNAIAMGVPIWNPTNESIDVWVKSPHFASDGTPLKGYLEVRIPREMAKCLWGVDLNGQISGKVSITYTDSNNPEVLTVTGTVTGNDYLMVSTGYHYSSPTIAIQLKNKQDIAVETPIKSVEEKPAITPIKSAKKSITCKKGTKTKKITSVAPKCPTGYKKVA